MSDGELARKPVDVVEVPVGPGISPTIRFSSSVCSLVFVFLVELILVELAIVERALDLLGGSGRRGRSLLGSPSMGTVLARSSREILALVSALITMTIKRDRQPVNAEFADRNSQLKHSHCAFPRCPCSRRR